MPMNPVILGAQMVLDLGVTDIVVAGLLIAAQVPFCNWIATNVKAEPGMGTPLTNLKAAGAAITGLGGFSYADVNALVNALCTAIGLTDPVGKSKASIVCQHLADTIAQHGVIVPSGLIAFTGPTPPDPGPVTGKGKLLLTDDFYFYVALNLTDTQSIDKWTTFGNTIKLHLHAFADVNPAPPNGSMMNAAAGGPVSGQGALE